MKSIRKSSLRNGLIVAGASLMLGACASSPTTYSAADSSTDFNQYRSYAFMDELHTDKHGYQSLETTYLKEAVASEMSRRGFVESPSPDIVINFSVESEEKVRSQSVPVSGIYADPYWGYGYGVGYETRINQYTVGYLSIVAVDAQSERTVWQGTTESRLTRKKMENARETLDGAVGEVFKHFPVDAPEMVSQANH